MGFSRPHEAGRPSRVSLATAVFSCLLAAGALVAAILHQRAATMPIGEGEVFARDTDYVAGMAGSSDDPSVVVRSARNTLEVESVSIVDTDGVIVASTSEGLVGTEVSNPLIAFGATTGRFMALAAPVEEAISIDGILEWEAGDVLYQVVSPMDDGRSALIHYDLSSLLARRSQPGDVQPGTLQLLGLGALFALIGGGVLVGRMRAARHYEEVVWESELLKTHAAELESANTALDSARSEAEKALALAEEKMRIRSEFVLMINHELRTPLTSVVTGAELLRAEGLGTADAHQVLAAMVSDGQRLQEIIDQILAVARIENRGLAYELVETPLDQVCAALMASHTLLESSHPLELHPSDAAVSTDLSTLSIVVASLADNAITHGASKVTLSCGPTPLIQPDLMVGDEPELAMYFAIEDDGPGIDPDFLPRVFEKFEKASFSSGTGLGLYMVRLMVEALEGSVAVATSKRGTTFEIAIPAVVSGVTAGVS